MSADIATFGLRIIPEPGAQIERCRSYAIDGFCGQLPELCAGIRDVQEVAIVHGRRDHDCDPAVAA
jgi:hypothetical protein